MKHLLHCYFWPLKYSHRCVTFISLYFITQRTFKVTHWVCRSKGPESTEPPSTGERHDSNARRQSAKWWWAHHRDPHLHRDCLPSHHDQNPSHCPFLCADLRRSSRDPFQSHVRCVRSGPHQAGRVLGKPSITSKVKVLSAAWLSCRFYCFDLKTKFQKWSTGFSVLSLMSPAWRSAVFHFALMHTSTSLSGMSTVAVPCGSAVSQESSFFFFFFIAGEPQPNLMLVCLLPLSSWLS